MNAIIVIVFSFNQTLFMIAKTLLMRSLRLELLELKLFNDLNVYVMI